MISELTDVFQEISLTSISFQATGSWDFSVKVWTLDHSTYRSIIGKHRKGTHREKNMFSKTSGDLHSFYHDDKEEGDDEDESDLDEVEGADGDNENEDDDEEDDDNDDANGHYKKNLDESYDEKSGDGQGEDVDEDEEEADDLPEEVAEHRTLVGHCGNIHSVAFSKIGMLVSRSFRTDLLNKPFYSDAKKKKKKKKKVKYFFMKQ